MMMMMMYFIVILSLNFDKTEYVESARTPMCLVCVQTVFQS